MKTIIVIPTYNERENIQALIRALFALGLPDMQVIVVDDNSPDKTGELARELTQSFPVHLIERPQKSGLGSAYIAGFKKALALGADAIVEMDADFSHDPADLSRLLAALRDADVVIGSRKIAGGRIIGWGPIRIMMSAGAMWISRALLKFTVRDVTAGFRCFKRRVLETVNLDAIHSNGYAFQEELLYRAEQAKFRVKEIPVTFLDRSRGKSKLGKKDIAEFFLIMMKLRREKI